MGEGKEAFRRRRRAGGQAAGRRGRRPLRTRRRRYGRSRGRDRPGHTLFRDRTLGARTLTHWIVLMALVQISKNKKVSVRNWKGRVFVDLREFYVKDGKSLPTRKGTTSDFCPSHSCCTVPMGNGCFFSLAASGIRVARSRSRYPAPLLAQMDLV